VDVIVDSIAGNHQSDRRDVQTGRVVRVGMTEFHGDQFLSFQIDDIAFHLFRENQLVRNLSRESRLPRSVERLRRCIPVHLLHGVGRRDRFGFRESLEKRAEPKPMVTVTMCDVYRCQILALCGNPICESVGLLDRHEGIHEDGVALTVDQGCRRCLKKSLAHARRLVASDDG